VLYRRGWSSSFQKKFESIIWFIALAPKARQIWSKQKTCPLCDVTKENPHLNQIILFLIKTRRLAESLEGLNSSLAIEACELLTKMCWPIYRQARPLKGEVTNLKNESTTVIVKKQNCNFCKKVVKLLTQSKTNFLKFFLWFFWRTQNYLGLLLY